MRHQSKTLKNIEGIAHGFFTRQGGVSEGIYASLNCGPGSDDDSDAVRENRRRVMEALDAHESSLCTLYQIHSDKVVAVRAPWSDQTRPHADAMVSKTPKMLLGILTADCGPVLFADPKAKVVGAAHAGWRGATGGVLENTIDAMESFGAKRQHIIAVIGPTIAQANYEVGLEFYEMLIKLSSDNDRFFSPLPDLPSARRGSLNKSPSPPRGEGRGEGGSKYRFDLPAYIRHRLSQSGLTAIEDIAMDTYSNEAEFFSYRRTTHAQEPDYGRQISAIMIKDE